MTNNTTDLTTADLTGPAIEMSLETRAYLALEEVRAAGVLNRVCLEASYSADLAWASIYVVDDVPDDTRIVITSDPATALAEIRAVLTAGVEESTDLRTQLRLSRSLAFVKEAEAHLATTMPAPTMSAGAGDQG